MEIVQISDPSEYLATIESLLLKKEASNNLPLGIVDRIVNGKEAIAGHSQAYLGIVKNKGATVYAFVQTPPHHLILTDVDELSSNIINAIADHLFKQGIMLPGVIGPSDIARRFVERWKRLTHIKPSIEMHQFVYRLDKLNELPLQEGKLVSGTSRDKELIAQWLVAFGEETRVDTTVEQAEQMATYFIEVQSVYLWRVNGINVSMVNQSRKSKHGASINAVYTPNEYKGNGYATASVATLSKKSLQQGNQFCSLFADAENQIANHIYKKMGYCAISDCTVYQFNS